MKGNGGGATVAAPRVDGRRARRERGRAAVIDAAFSLIEEAHIPPPVDEVAARSGVSVSTVFRYFEGIDDLQVQALARFRERYEPLLQVPGLGAGGLVERTTRFVDARLELYRAAGTIMTVGRLRALESAPLALAMTDVRLRLADQIAAHFAVEIAQLTPARRDDVVTTIDVLTSAEAWWSLDRVHGRSPTQIRRAWRAGINALLVEHGPERNGALR